MRRTRFMVMAAIPLLAVAGLLLPPSHALAAGTTWTVQSTTDDDGTVPCLVPADTCVTLRDAINQASADSGDTISLGSGTYTLSMCSGTPPAAGALEISSSMTITGQGSAQTTISGGACASARAIAATWNDSLMFACNSVAVTVDGVTLTNGDASNAGPSDSATGGAINMGGTSFCDPVNPALTLADVDVLSNSSENDGGGIYSAGADLSLTNVTFSGNTARNGSGGGMFFSGANTLSLRDVFAHDNTQQCDCAGSAVGGGAFLINDTSATAGSATNLLIENNTAGGNTGGGVLQRSTGTVDWTNLTFDGNSAPQGGAGYGGALYITNGATAHLTNVTATANRAGTWGGAFGLGFPAATMTIRAGTINGNSTAAAGEGGGLFTDSGPITLTQTIVHGNLANGSLNECHTQGIGSVASGGYNLADDATCGLGQPTDSQDPAKDPLLASLATNSAGAGVPPMVGAGADAKALTTEALGTGSAALNAVPASVCPPPSTDERGVTRPQGAACEIGAFETASGSVPVPPAGAVPTAVTVPLVLALLVIGGVLAGSAVAAPSRRRRVRP